jgi:T5SS/PEP-CTERM-associated repeat protein/autotransporter-associated beta strand protein
MLGRLRTFLLALQLKLIFTVLGAAIFFAFATSAVNAAITWSGDVSPTDPATWTSSTSSYIGKSLIGTITIDGESELLSNSCYLGYSFGSDGTVTVRGNGSKWTNSGDLEVGYRGQGTLNIEAGGQVISNYCGVNYSANSNAITVNGIGSKLTCSKLQIGYSGNGTMKIEAGGEVNIITGSYIDAIGYSSGATGAVIVTGAGSKLTNVSSLFVGYHGNGTLTVADGGEVITSGFYGSINNLFGDGIITTKGAVLDADFVFNKYHGAQTSVAFGSGGTINIAPLGEHLGAGYKSSGTMKITDGISVASNWGFLGYLSGSAGTATVTGAGSTWANSGNFYAGYLGNGTLNIDSGGIVSNASGYIGYATSSIGMASITGIGSAWTNSGDLYVGYSGQGSLNVSSAGQVTSNYNSNNGVLCVGYSGHGILNIDSGGQVKSFNGHLCSNLGSTATVKITDLGSKWTIGNYLYVGYLGNATLNVEAGGQVSDSIGYIGYGTGSSGSATVTGTGSKWINSGNFFVGRGVLNINAGGQVSDINGYLGDLSNANSTAIVSDDGSVWLNSGTLTIGNSGSGTLNIGVGNAIGGLVTAKNLVFANSSRGSGFCNINNGGILQTGSITKGPGTASINWNDGTIRNYDATTDLSITNANNLILKLAATGTHTLSIDSRRIAIINAVLADATSDGTLNKVGTGLLTLTAANTYSGATTVNEGRFKVTGTILNTSGITVSQTGILELAKSSGSATAAKLNIDNAGTVLISAGSQTVGVITGIGITQVTGSASLTAQSIVQNTLTIGGTGVSSMNAVPEPTSIALLFTATLGGLLWHRRR